MEMTVAVAAPVAAAAAAAVAAAADGEPVVPVKETSNIVGAAGNGDVPGGEIGGASGALAVVDVAHGAAVERIVVAAVESGDGVEREGAVGSAAEKPSAAGISPPRSYLDQLPALTSTPE